MKNPIRVLIVEDRKSKRSIAQQLLDNYDLDFTWQRVAGKTELEDVTRQFDPSLVYCTNDLPADSQSDALAMLHLLSLQSAVIHIAETNDKNAAAVHTPITLKAKQPKIPRHAAASVQRDDATRNSLPSLPDVGGNAVAMSDSSGWITYANIIASRLLRDSSEHMVGTLLGRDYEFAAPVRGAQRLVIFDARTGSPSPVHLSDLVEQIVAAARRTPGAPPIMTLALGALSLTKHTADGALDDDALRSITSQFIAEAGGRGMIARVGKDDMLAVLPDLSPVSQASVGCDASAFHAAIIESGADTRPPLEAGLDDALQRHAISVHYQPQFELQTGRGCGVEALARWSLSNGECVAPVIFIPVAERAGMIHALGANVLRNACMTAATWRGREEERMTVSVNLSTLQINRAFVNTLSEIIATSGLRASRLELEIAESAVLANTDLTATCLKEWQQLGVRVAVNHAGQNYSGLSYLSRLSINRLKLDKSLIQAMTPAKQSVGIVHALISLGAELGIEVIAEGVETSAQFQLLTELGCQQVQGYLLARPAPAVQAQLALRRSWGCLPNSVPRPTSEVAARQAS